MTLVEYDNDNSHARVKKMFVLLAPRNKFDGTGGLEALGFFTDIEFAAANAYGIGINQTNSGTGVAHVDVNVLPDPLLGRENKQYYPSIFVHGAKVVGTYLDEARRDRFGVIPDKPVLPWDAIKIDRFNDLNVHFGDQYQEKVRLSEHDEYRSYVDQYNKRPHDEYRTAYAVLITTPSTQFAPVIADVASIFYGEPNSEQEAVTRALKFREDNPTAPRLVVAPLPVNAPVGQFVHSMFDARNHPELMPYHDSERAASLDVREYENMLAEVGRIHNTNYIDKRKLSA